ncbi:MAG: flavodoxin family protein [Selenomonas sp.]|nr:flavodoxin family protein [Selenomonas sp.]
MKRILVLNGSPRKGNTEALAEAFIKGAREAGHEGEILNLRQLTIKPCKGCMLCQQKKGNPCIQQDDMQKIYDAFAKADMVVFASPVYWMQFTGLFKVMLDRLFALAPYGIGKKEAALIMAATTAEDFIFEAAVPYYENCLVKNLGWENRGMILAKGVNDVGDVEKTDYVRQAYESGKSI